MKNYGTFDILGPIMIGPSSSHTAGAARLGKVSKEIVREGFNRVTFYLHGSFAKTYRGHGTDRALVGGILGMDPDDEGIINALDTAKKSGLDIIFKEANLGYVHPNTVKIVFGYDDAEDYYIIGSSIGGGNIIITDINSNQIEFTGDFPTLLIRYADTKGTISRITSIIAEEKINIATLKVSRDENIATMVLEADSELGEHVIEKIDELKEIINIIVINPNKGGA